MIMREFGSVLQQVHECICRNYVCIVSLKIYCESVARNLAAEPPHLATVQHVGYLTCQLVFNLSTCDCVHVVQNCSCGLTVPIYTPYVNGDVTVVPFFSSSTLFSTVCIWRWSKPRIQLVKCPYLYSVYRINQRWYLGKKTLKPQCVCGYASKQTRRNNRHNQS